MMVKKEKKKKLSIHNFALIAFVFVFNPDDQMRGLMRQGGELPRKDFLEGHNGTSAHLCSAGGKCGYDFN